MLVAEKRYSYEPLPEYYRQQEKNSKVKVYTIRREKAIRRFKALLGIAIFFAVGMLIIFRYSQLNEENKNIYKLKAQLSELNKNNTQLEAKLNKEIDLVQVEKAAIQKLGMQYPDKNQTIYVQLPKSDFTEIPTNIVVAKSQPDDGALSAFAKQLVRYLY